MEEQKAIEQMTVLMVEPGYEPYEKAIPNTLAAKQELVGGLITAIYPYEEMVAIVANDESILLGMDFNRSVEGGYGGICGTFFVCGLGEDNFASLSPELIEKYREKFRRAEILLGVKGNTPITFKTEARPKARPEKPKPRHEAQR